MPKKTGFLSTHSMGLLQTKKGMLNIPFFYKLFLSYRFTIHLENVIANP